MKLVYEYSEIDQLKTPHTYMYTKYFGKEFLRVYLESRKLITEKIAKSISNEETNNVLNIYFEKYRLNKNDLMKELEVGFKNTQDLLLKIAAFLHYEESVDFIYDVLSSFCKKYEVSKKIYSSYDYDNIILKKTSDDCENILNYILVAYCFIKFYKITSNLKFFNCALKVLDLNCSVLELVDEVSEEYKYILMQTIVYEKKSFEDLIEKKGIEL